MEGSPVRDKPLPEVPGSSPLSLLPTELWREEIFPLIASEDWGTVRLICSYFRRNMKSNGLFFHSLLQYIIKEVLLGWIHELRQYSRLSWNCRFRDYKWMFDDCRWGMITVRLSAIEDKRSLLTVIVRALHGNDKFIYKAISSSVIDTIFLPVKLRGDPGIRRLSFPFQIMNYGRMNPLFRNNRNIRMFYTWQPNTAQPLVRFPFYKRIVSMEEMMSFGSWYLRRQIVLYLE